MVQQNIATAALRSIVVDTIGDIIYFPIWWYTVGLVYIARTRVMLIKDYWNQLALKLLLVNMFKPMFAQFDRAGRIISFFLRIVILAFQMTRFVVYAAFEIALFIAWIALPIVIFFRLMTASGLLTITFYE